MKLTPKNKLSLVTNILSAALKSPSVVQVGTRKNVPLPISDKQLNIEMLDDNKIKISGFALLDKSGDLKSAVLLYITTALKKRNIPAKIDPIENVDEIVIDIDDILNEVAVRIFKRDPKTNKIKTAFKCIGGLKDGRRVSNPDECLSKPDIQKRIRAAINSRKKRSTMKMKRKITQKTNLMSRRAKNANKRLKKARGI
ncbi:MAG: hypothetical protein D6698_11925 [Gammaproteobacteria bacterium]|nr:MAG: hypothetical protein D6698_11925 [Gammaproteobacteria bacterium]